MEGYIVVFITAPKDKGIEIARSIVEKRMGACVNIVAQVNSIYWWKGNIEEDEESLLIVKTTAEKFGELKDFVKGIHPYTVPEIIALPILSGNEEYLRWMDENING